MVSGRSTPTRTTRPIPSLGTSRGPTQQGELTSNDLCTVRIVRETPVRRLFAHAETAATSRAGITLCACRRGVRRGGGARLRH